MLPTAPDLAHIALVGIGATAVLDAWLWLLQGLGVPDRQLRPDRALGRASGAWPAAARRHRPGCARAA